MRGFDFDGVITHGILPAPDDVIITGRVPDRAAATYKEMKALGLENAVYFMPPKHKEKGTLNGRKMTGKWKAEMINRLGITEFFEDDPVQKAEMDQLCPKTIINLVAR